jgi:hypothetical protein
MTSGCQNSAQTSKGVESVIGKSQYTKYGKSLETGGQQRVNVLVFCALCLFERGAGNQQRVSVVR